MDDIDMAGEHIEKTLAAQIKQASSSRFTVMATGECLECGEPLASGMRWCSAACTRGFEKRVNRATGGRI